MSPGQDEVSMQNDRQYKSFEALQAKQSEIEVLRIIAEAFPGVPGLLVRSLESGQVLKRTMSCLAFSKEKQIQ